MCRCDERLKGKVEGYTHLTYTGWCGGLEHLNIETRLLNERFVSVMGECDLDTTGAPSIFKIIRSAEASARLFPILDKVCFHY